MKMRNQLFRHLFMGSNNVLEVDFNYFLLFFQFFFLPLIILITNIRQLY